MTDTDDTTPMFQCPNCGEERADAEHRCDACGYDPSDQGDAHPCDDGKYRDNDGNIIGG